MDLKQAKRILKDKYNIIIEAENAKIDEIFYGVDCKGEKVDLKVISTGRLFMRYGLGEWKVINEIMIG